MKLMHQPDRHGSRTRAGCCLSAHPVCADPSPAPHAAAPATAAAAAPRPPSSLSPIGPALHHGCCQQAGAPRAAADRRTAGAASRWLLFPVTHRH